LVVVGVADFVSVVVAGVGEPVVVFLVLIPLLLVEDTPFSEMDFSVEGGVLAFFSFAGGSCAFTTKGAANNKRVTICFMSRLFLIETNLVKINATAN
jgi:hypothetical protein